MSRFLILFCARDEQKNVRKIMLLIQCQTKNLTKKQRESMLQMNQLHEVQLEAVTGEGRPKIGSKFPSLSGPLVWRASKLRWCLA